MVMKGKKIGGMQAMADTYDFIILGGGNAGSGVSAIVHEAGKKIAFVEERDLSIIIFPYVTINIISIFIFN